MGIGFFISNKFILKQKLNKTEMETEKKKLNLGRMIDLDEMILTLLTKTGETKYFKFQLTIEIIDKKENINIENLKPLLYDIIIKVGNKYYAEDLLTEFG
ncbi:MAG: hypothetical protein NZ891_00535, partial [bacterium]|nr:hypothetical protein [bacterium]MDW8163218.1 hypothetical protein [Candidatus Omnitrophota bacterium]